MNFNDPFFKQVDDIRKQIKIKEKFTDMPFSSIVIAGMGGSGVSGRIFASLFQKKPVYVVDSYDLPEFVQKDSFFIAQSYSGNTEETISVAEQAKKRGIKVHAVTSGGKLKEISDETIIIPSGLQPREALSYLLMPLLNTFMESVLKDSDLEKAIDQAASKRDEIQDIAKKIVESKKIPYILSWEPFSPMSYRFKTQFNENSKLFALSHVLSEQNHNELVPMAMNREMREKFFYLCIEGEESSKNSKRMEMVERISGQTFVRIRPEGRNILEKLFFLVHYLDLLTVMAGILGGYNPEDVRVLENLKKDLSKN